MRTLLISILIVLGGCASTGTGPYATPSEAARDSLRAQRLTRQAVDLIHRDPERAETLLREALSADLYHGPAHNNLGIIHLERGELYEAAHEFEWARKLLPGHPDPRLNLAMTLERAGRIDEALATYDAALEVYPGHLPSIQALCRCQLRYRKTDDRTARMLDEIALRGESERWRRWAREQAIKLTAREG